MKGWPEAQKATFASCSIDGKGQIWSELTKQIYAAEDRPITWKDFNREFFDQYTPSVAKDGKVAEFLHLKQGR